MDGLGKKDYKGKKDNKNTMAIHLLKDEHGTVFASLDNIVVSKDQVKLMIKKLKELLKQM